MIGHWEEFAAKVITELMEYDRENKTSYSYYFQHDTNAHKVLADMMRIADKKNMWTPVPKDKKND